MQGMNAIHIEKIKSDFDEQEVEVVVKTLQTISLSHVMANSQMNLDNTLSAILQLSKGDLNKLNELVSIAKLDFRDVIVMANANLGSK